LREENSKLSSQELEKIDERKIIFKEKYENSILK